MRAVLVFPLLASSACEPATNAMADPPAQPACQPVGCVKPFVAVGYPCPDRCVC